MLAAFALVRLVLGWQHEAALAKPDGDGLKREIAEGDVLPGELFTVAIGGDDVEGTTGAFFEFPNLKTLLPYLFFELVAKHQIN